MSSASGRLLRAATRHLKFMRPEPQASACARQWRASLAAQLRGGSGEAGGAPPAAGALALRDEDPTGADARLVEEYSHLLRSLGQKRRLQILDAGAETLMSPQELTRLAAKRVGLDVPKEFGEARQEGTAAAAGRLTAIRDRLEREHEGLGDEDEDEARAREARIRAVAAKAQAALAAEQFRRSK